VLAEGPNLRLRDPPEHVRGRSRGTPLVAPGKTLPLREARDTWLRAFTYEYLTDLLREHGGNVSQAARTAGVDRKTLHRLLMPAGREGGARCPRAGRRCPTWRRGQAARQPGA
jgi:transcriptional regulator of acetoin/glycerol metabolism